MIRLISGWFASLALGMLVVGPLAALGVCALVDVGPGGEARTSLFPAAVTALDPFVWASFRHSAIVAGLASLATIAGGTLVGRVVGESGGLSRAAAVVVLGIAAASPPYLIALGAAAWLDAGGSAAWVRLLLASGRWSHFLPVDPGWIAWAAASAIPGAAMGAMAYLRALDGFAPSWREAAVLAGGSRSGRWRRLAWPLLRPAMARAGALTFALTLADPGPPLLLGLRRTLGYQMVLVATGDSTFPALASLGLIAILAAAAWRAALRLWSGRDRATAGDRDDRPRPPASWRRAVATSTIAAGLGALVVAAMVGLGMIASRGATLDRATADPTMARILVRSLVLGLGVAVLAALSDRIVARLESTAGPAAAGRFRRLAKASAPPPIAAGIVILALGRLLTLASAAGWTGPSPLAAILAGDRAPMIAATLAAWLAVASSRIGRRPLGTADADAAPATRLDAASMAGARRGSARRLAGGARFGGGWRDFVAILTTAAVAVAPAVLVLSSASIATVGPAVSIFRDRPVPGAAIAATLGAVAWAVALATAPIGAGRRRIASTPGPPRA